MVSATTNLQSAGRSIGRAERILARREIRRQRHHLSISQRHRAAKFLDRQLASCPAFQRARRVAIYWPADAEIDISPLVRRCRNMGKQLFLPVLMPAPTGRMQFAPFKRNCQMKINRYGIPEPVSPMRGWFGSSQLDLIVIPLVAMDEAGNRIGMGGGYYDKTLQNVVGRAISPTLLGVGYQFQLVKKIEPQPWDVTLHWVATDQCLQAVAPVHKRL